MYYLFVIFYSTPIIRYHGVTILDHLKWYNNVKTDKMAYFSQVGLP